MRAMVLQSPGQPLRLEDRPDPQPSTGEIRLRVRACAVCRTDLHVVDGELPVPRLPIVPGHEIVGVVDRVGPGVHNLQTGPRSLGAVWAGSADEAPPRPLDAAIIFAPAGALVPRALQAVRKGGRVVCAGIHMSDIPAFPYRLLWEERELVSVANLTRADATEFLREAAAMPLQVATVTYPLARANEALDDLRAGRLRGAAVLVP